MPDPWILGIDPGGQTTGLCLIDPDGKATDWALVKREDLDLFWYLDRTQRAVAEIEERGTREIGAFIEPREYAIEDIVHPNAHMGLANLDGLLDTAQVLGALRALYPCHLVRPGRHGSHMLASYPPELVGPREKTGKGEMRHVRSAFDVARTYRTLRRQGRA